MKKRHLVLGLLCALGVILYIDRICISVALPEIQKDLDLSPEQLGWISVAFTIAYGIFEIPSGHLGDRYGSRRALARITLWWSAFTALTGAAFGLTSLLITRFMFGAGEAGAWPNTSLVVAKWYPKRQRGAALGAFGAATAIGGALSPLFVIPLQREFGWRLSFFLFALLGVAWAAVWMLWFRDSPREMNTSPAELAELDEIPPLAAHALPWSVVLRKRSMWGLMGMAFAAIYAAIFVGFWMPTFLVKARGFSSDEIKWTALVWIASCLGNLGGGALSDRSVARFGRATGRRIVGVTYMLILAVSLFIATQTDDKMITLAGCIACGAAFGAIQANAFATAIDLGGVHIGTVAGTMNTAAQAGAAVSSLLFGYLVKSSGSYDVPVIVMAAVCGVGALSWCWIDASKPLAGA